MSACHIRYNSVTNQSFKDNLGHDYLLPVFGGSSDSLALLEGAPFQDEPAPDFQIISCERQIEYFLLFCINYLSFSQVLLTVTSMWGLCAILTVSGALSHTSNLRTDLRSDMLAEAVWIRVPYPCEN